MKKDRVRSKHGFKGFGTFILGWLIGFISTLGILFGVGYWAYTSLSVNKIEKLTKTEITDNQGLEDLTLKKAIGIVQGISSNGSNAYTISQMEEDFGVNLINDSIYGVSLDIIKNSPITNLKQAIDDTVDSITFNNVLNFMEVEQDDLGLLNTVLETEFTYYVYNGKLYTDKEYTIEVGFNYTIEGNTVKFANGTHTMSLYNGVYSIKPRFSDLPLNTAMSSIEDTTKSLKIYEILDYECIEKDGKISYTDNDQPVSGIMANLAEYTIDDLSNQDKFNQIYIYEVMGYTDLGDGEYSYINDSDQEVRVTGAMKAIAGMTIGEISKPETINSLQIYKLMDYYYNEVDKCYYEDFDGTSYYNKVTGTMKTLAGKTIEDLSDPDLINNLHVWEVMGFDQEGEAPNYIYYDGGKEVSGIMATLAEKKISELDDSGAFDDVTVADAMGYYENGGKYYKTYNELTNTYGDEVTGIYAHIASSKVSGLSARINTLTVGQVLDKDINETSGVIKALYSLNINELSNKDTINGIYIWQVMDYTPVTGGYTYVDDEGNTQTVTGAMKALAGKTIGQLSDPNTISDLKVWEVMGYYENGGKYYKTYDGTNYSEEISGAIKALAGKTVGELDDETTGINSIELGQILDIDYVAAPSIVKALYSSQIGSLNNDISQLQVYEVMGYYYDSVSKKYYEAYNEETKTYSDEVKGIMGAIAGTNINDIGSTVEGLLAKDVFDVDTTPILKLFETNELESLTVMDLPSKVTEKVNGSTIEQLVNSGLVELSETEKEGAYYNSIKGLKLKDIILGNFS